MARFERAPVQHVVESAVEPRLTSRVVVSWSDRFVVDVRKVAAQARDLLYEPVRSIRRQLAVALIPEVITMRERPSDAAAVGLDGVFGYEVRLERWQFPVPKHDLRFVVTHSGSHRRASVEDDERAPKPTQIGTYQGRETTWDSDSR